MTTIDNNGALVPVDINSPENMNKLKTEVQAEFTTSKERSTKMLYVASCIKKLN